MSKLGLLITAIILVVSCGDPKENKEQTNSPRIKKETKVLSPRKNQQYTIGDAITFEIKTSKGLSVDSISVEFENETYTFQTLTFEVEYVAKRVGVIKPKVTVFFDGKKETHYPRATFLPSKNPQEYTYEIINTYPHNTDDYIQGLLVDKGFLYESTGRNGYSTLKKKNITTGESIQQLNLTDDYFGEGLAVLNNQFYQLTYTAGACFVYNTDFEQVRSFSYQGEGWGLCEFEGNLAMTNGSENIYIRDPQTFAIVDELQVYDAKGKVESLNELEVIDGLIYANVYQESYIVAIDPESGAVVKKIDLKSLLQEVKGTQIDVLNGIAYDKETDRIFVTGKLWPKLFEVKFIPKNPIQ